MPKSPFKGNQLELLKKEMDESYKKLAPFRRNRKHMILDYVGNNYSDFGPSRQILANLIYQTAEIYTMSLAANRPRALLTTDNKDLFSFSKHFQTAVNNLAKEIRIEDPTRLAVLDAFFSIGIVKVYRGNALPIEMEEGVFMDPGRPYIERVSLDNHNHDIRKGNISYSRYMSDKYWMDLDDVKEEEYFDKKLTQELTGDRGPRSQENDDGPVSEIIQGSDGDYASMSPVIELEDVWLPQDGLVMTWATQNRVPLRFVEWESENGPYHILSLSDVPDNSMPSAPCQNLKPMADVINSILRKLVRQANRQKDVHVYEGRAAGDAERIRRARDGEWVLVNRADGVSVMKQGGIDQVNNAFLLQDMDLYDRLAGGLKTMGGLGVEAPTLGQEQMIGQRVNKKEAKMLYRVSDWYARIFFDLGKMMWDDQVMEVPGQMEILGEQVNSPWEPGDREGDFLEYNFDVEPYSLPYQSPSDRIETILGLLERVYYPNFEMVMQQGGGIDYRELTDMLAEMANVPRLKRIMTFGESAKPSERAMKGDQMIKPAETTRNYVRHNVPTGGTESNRRATMAQALLGQMGNPDQMAAMTNGGV